MCLPLSNLRSLRTCTCPKEDGHSAGTGVAVSLLIPTPAIKQLRENIIGMLEVWLQVSPMEWKPSKEEMKKADMMDPGHEPEGIMEVILSMPCHLLYHNASLTVPCQATLECCIRDLSGDHSCMHMPPISLTTAGEHPLKAKLWCMCMLRRRLERS